MLSSEGPGLARDLYVNLTLTLPGVVCTGGVRFPDMQNWKGYQSFGCIYNLVATPDFRLSPHMLAHPLNIMLHLEEPFTEALYYKIIFGCSDSPAKRIEVRVTAEEIAEKIQDFLNNPNAENMKHQIVADIMKMEKEEYNLIERESFYETL